MLVLRSRSYSQGQRRVSMIGNVPLVRISHLLDFDPWLEGICERRFSNKSFISLLRFLSAIL